MELLGFLLAVLAIAFVFAKLIFSRKAEKTPKRDAEWEAYMEGLKDEPAPEEWLFLRTLRRLQR